MINTFFYSQTSWFCQSLFIRNQISSAFARIADLLTLDDDII